MRHLYGICYWKDDWEKAALEEKKAAPRRGPAEDAAKPKEKIRVELQPMTLDDFKKMKELKLTMEECDSRLRSCDLVRAVF